jgi:hypothetical protein
MASSDEDQLLSYIKESHIFRILDQLLLTAAGLDQLPAWFLRLEAPMFRFDWLKSADSELILCNGVKDIYFTSMMELKNE